MYEIKNYEINSYQENPFGLFLILSRYKFAARLVRESDRVLDLGCGVGIGTTFISSFCKEVTGIDSKVENIEMAKKRHQAKNTTYQVDDARTYSPGRRFNVVVSLDVIEHMSINDAKDVLNNAKSLLTDDGFAVIGTPNVKSREYASAGRKLGHIHEYSYKEFRELLEREFNRVIVFSMTDEAVNTGFQEMAWYFMALCF